MVAQQINQFRRELGFTWKKFLWLTALGAVLGVAFVLALPLRVS